MKWAWILLTVYFTWIPPGLGIYHLPTSKLLSLVTSQENAYFGYSITHERKSNRLIVSAPQQSNVGEVYSCNITTQTCVLVQNIIKVDSEHKILKDYNHSYWFGATVKAGSSYFVTCAPLAIEWKEWVYNKKIVNLIGTFGRCYKYIDAAKPPDVLSNLSDKDKKRYYSDYFEHTMTSFGWSIDIADDDEMLIGGPAMVTGRVIDYYDHKKSPAIIVSLNGAENGAYNFGYSVVSGHFKSADTLTYAIAAPYGKSGEGKISFYYTNRKKGVSMVNVKDLSGDDDTVGSMFGAVLCSAQLTPTVKTTSLLVGAPTYSTKDMYNRGAVFVYKPKTILPLKDLQKKLLGFKAGSYFGSAIVSVGDLNGDGLDEIAIGAPYEDEGSGAVYLYSSADIGNNEKMIIQPLQRIAGASDGSQRSFGLSLSAIQDYDRNGCNELAVGAPESNMVKVFSCIASVTVKLDVEIPELRRFNDTSFTFSSCLNVEYPPKPTPANAKIKVQVKISEQFASFANPEDKEYLIELDGRSRKCRNIKVNVKRNRETGSNPALNIVYTINATQMNPPRDDMVFNPNHVALSDLSVLALTGSIWITECKNQQFCIPDLEYVDTSIAQPTPYEIGSTNTLDVVITVHNKGEAAYDACLYVNFVGAGVMMSPQECLRISETELKCAPKQVLSNGTTWKTQAIMLQADHLTTEYKDITIFVKVYNHCSKNEFTERKKTIELTANSDTIEITSATDSSSNHTVYLTKSEVATGKDFNHIYTISNYGNTTWANVKATLVIQKRDFLSNLQISFYTKDSVTAEPCQKEMNPTDLQLVYTCEIDKLYNKSSAIITVPMSVAPGVIEKLINDKENTVKTNLSIVLTFNGSNKTISQGETSALLISEGRVPWWVYLIAIIMGLIILVVFFFILRSCGFFEREAKENLEQVQRQVKRQTIMRRSMVNSVRVNSGPDQESLVVVESTNPPTKPERRVQLDTSDTQ